MKKRNVLPILLLILAITIMTSVAIFSKELTNLDETWNYNISRNFTEGKLPYKDFNFVQMPGFFLIVSLFLKISNQLIVTRILAVILCSGIIFFTYKIFETYKINKSIAGGLSATIAWLYLDYFSLDYNFLNLFIILLMIYIETRNIENNSKKYNIGMGILVGFSFIVKQTTGAFTIFAFLLIKLLEIRKQEIEKTLKTVFLRCIGISIPILLFINYLTINNIWSDFINYTILALTTFSNKIPYKELLINNKIWIRVLSIIIPAYFAGLTMESIFKREKKYMILLLYGIASFIVVYPISDEIHFLIGAMPALIGLLCIIVSWTEIIITKKIKEKTLKLTSELLNIAFCTTMAIIIMIQGKNLVNICKSNLQYTALNYFRYIPVSDNLKERIYSVDEYILKNEKEGKKTYILEAEACMYMIPINKYNKDYDMFLKGNLGKEGEEGQIEKLKQIENSYILIFHNSQNRNWQTPTKVMEYIEKNLTKVESIKSFDVYSKFQFYK